MGGQGEKRLKDYDIPHLGIPSLGPAKSKGYPAESWGIKDRGKSVSGLVKRHIGGIKGTAAAHAASGKAKRYKQWEKAKTRAKDYDKAVKEKYKK